MNKSVQPTQPINNNQSISNPTVQSQFVGQSPTRITSLSDYQSVNSPSIVAMSKESDRLFQKWLKLQISQIYFNMLIRLVMIVLFVSSIFVSVGFLGPFLREQLPELLKMQSSIVGFYNSSNPADYQSSNQNSDVINIIKQLNSQTK